MVTFVNNLLVKRIAITSLCMLFFTFFYDYEVKIVVLSCLFVATIYLSFLYSVVLCRIRSIGIGKFVTCLLLSAIDLCLLLLFIANLISNHIWMSNITFSMLLPYLGAWKSMLKNFPLLVIGGLIYAFIFFRYLLFLFSKWNRLIREIDYIVLGCGDFLSVIKRVIYSATIILIGVGVFLQTNQFQREGRWLGEPISSFVLDFIPMGTKSELLTPLITQQRKSESKLKNVVFIVSDALRADHMGVYGYSRQTTPKLSKLVKDKKPIVLSNVFATCPESTCGIKTILSSTDFVRHSTNVTHIGDVLKGYGYNTIFMLTGAHNWGGLREFYRADEYSDGTTRKNFTVNDDKGTIADLNALSFSDVQPTFLYIHLYSTHQLGFKEKSFEMFRPEFNNSSLIFHLFSDETEQKKMIVNEYDNRVLQADYWISKIYEILENKGVLDNSIVVMTSDHGEALGEHGFFRHIHHLYQEFLSVPLMIFGAKDNSLKNSSHISQLDIAPTVLSMLGISVPTVWEGNSLFNNQDINKISNHYVTKMPSWRARILSDASSNNIYKYLWKEDNSDQKTDEMLFNLTDDPLERDNLLIRQGMVQENKTILSIISGSNN